jgi:putative NADPH-quinone reductase
MAKKVLIIDGHPDAVAEHYLHALSTAYRDGARAGGHTVRSIVVSELAFPVLRSKNDFETGSPASAIRECQEALSWADHVVILFPLWLGSMPALLKAFFEQLLRPRFAFSPVTDGGCGKKLLIGKSARIIITMGMPALVYRWYFRGHALKALERNILGFCGIGPVRACVIGPVESMSQAGRGNWLARIQHLGTAAR